MSKFHVVSDGDLDTQLELLRYHVRHWVAYCKEEGNDDPDTEAFLRHAINCYQGNRFVVCVAFDNEGTPIGSMSLNIQYEPSTRKEVGWIDGLYVLPAWRDGTVVKALGEEMERITTDRGVVECLMGAKRKKQADFYRRKGCYDYMTILRYKANGRTEIHQ